VFKFAPGHPTVEKAFVHVGFVAVDPAAGVGYPFDCTAHLGAAQLLFAPDGPDPALCRRIATEFWDLLLAQPDVLADFSDRIRGDFGLQDFGCQRGRLYWEGADGN
jgi:hypothetical protein